MRDKEFLDIFDKIDDKFIKETYLETEKLRRGSRRSFFHAVYTAAACIMVAAAAVLAVSSFIDRGKLLNPSGAGDASEIISDGDISDNSGSSDSEIPDTSEPLNYENNFYYVKESSLTFPGDYYYDGFDADVPAFYAYNQQQSVRAIFSVTADLLLGYYEEFSGTIPMRMYLFIDGQQSLFKHGKANIPCLSLDLTPNESVEIDFSFNAGRTTDSATIVCVFFPGDAARQTCFISSAFNSLSSFDYDPIFDGSHIFIDDIPEQKDIADFLTLSEKTFNYDKYSPFEFCRSLASEKPESVSGNPVKTLSADSANIYMHYNFSPDILWDRRFHRLIALIDGEPAPVFDGEFVTAVELLNKELYCYKIPSEYLSENSTVQIIALPVRVYEQNTTGIQSECCLIKE